MIPGPDDLLPVLAALVLVIGLGVLSGSLFVRFRQSPVLGELLGGVALGNLGLLGIHGLDGLKSPRGLNELLEPINSFLVPVFFVLMGMRVDLAVFGRSEVVGFAAALSVAAVIGKQLCALGV